MAGIKIRKVDYNQAKSNDNGQLLSAFSTLNTSSSNKTSFPKIKVSEINLDPNDEFTHLFPLDKERVNSIAESMINNGIDPTQPIHIAEILTESDTKEKPFIIDGMHRRAAALQAGIEELPFHKHIFNTRDEAKLYAYGLQILRRNLNDSDLLKIISIVDEIKTPGRNGNGSGKSSVELAKKFNISARTAEKARKVIREASDEQLQQIDDGEASINSVYNDLPEVKKRKGTKKQRNEDALEDNSENPSPVFIKERKPSEPSEYELNQKKIEAEKVAQNKKLYDDGFSEGMSKGFNTCLIFVLAKVLAGLSVKEIYNLPELQDLSAGEVIKFELSSDDEDSVYKVVQE